MPSDETPHVTEIAWGVSAGEVFEDVWHLEAMKALVVASWEALREHRQRVEGLQRQLGSCREELRVARQVIQGGE